MRVLVACEESQAVCTAFRERGHEAYSCDVQPCSGGHPEWHIQGDALLALQGGRLYTMDGRTHDVDAWDMLIAHPPCTYLTSSSASRLFSADHNVKDEARERRLWEARAFFLSFVRANVPKIAVENPAPLKYAALPPYQQIIEPWMFGHEWKKRTCLWLKGLPPLFATDLVIPRGCWVAADGGKTCRTKLLDIRGTRDPKERSKTFPGIARAMAEQWG